MKRGLMALTSMILLAAGAAPGAEPVSTWGQIFDAEEDCSATPPAAYSPPILDHGHEITLEVAVLLDGVKKQRARELIGIANTAYAQLNIDLLPVSYRRLRLGGSASGPGESRPKIDGVRAIARAKSFFGGERPEGVDVVHLLTTRDVTLPTYGSAPVGVAECAGGVQYADKAFSVSEDYGGDAYSLDAAGLTNILNVPAEALAHEIGHLLGGLHEYKSCAEGVGAEDATNRDPSPCTIMSDVVDTASLRFGTLEATVIRGYALRFADK